MDLLGKKKSRCSNKESLKAAGRIHDSVESTDDHELLNNVLEIRIMEEEMKFAILGPFAKAWRAVNGSSKGSSSNKDLRGVLFKHDSVVVKTGVGKWIKAEKDGVPEPGKNMGGIKLVTVEDSRAPEMWQDPQDKGPGRYHVRFVCAVNLGEGKEKWTVKKLRQLLSSVTPDYHLTSHNCWAYAHSSAKGVLEWAVENTQSAPARVALKAKLKELEELERPRPTDVARAVLKPSHARSRESIQKFQMKLEHTWARLPVNATNRLLRVNIMRRILRWMAPATPARGNDVYRPRRLTGG